MDIKMDSNDASSITIKIPKTSWKIFLSIIDKPISRPLNLWILII